MTLREFINVNLFDILINHGKNYFATIKLTDLAEFGNIFHRLDHLPQYQGRKFLRIKF